MTEILIIILALFVLYFHVRDLIYAIRIRGYTTITAADSSFLHEGDDVYLNGEKLRIVEIEGNTITTKGRYEPIDS